MQSRLFKAGWKLLDVLFPPSCAGCGSWGKRFCANCFEKTTLIKDPICQLCGDKLFTPGNILCHRCTSQAGVCSAIRSWAVFAEPLQTAIHKLKYRQDRGLAGVLAQPLVDLLNRYHWQIDLIIPVPLDSERRKERGYNQAALLTKPVAWTTGMPFDDISLKRIRTTRPQVGLSIADRNKNMAGAFVAEGGNISGKKILLIDDVITTGSTINSCAQALIKAGADQVYGLTLARSSHA